MASRQPLVVIVGPTASGKTALAIEIAKQHDGEVVCADSRTVYQEMDIGTAKPTADEQEGVPHWGLDLVKPDETFTAGRFQAYAKETIADIRQRGKLPVLVGGTGLYVDSVVFDYVFPRPINPTARKELESLTRGQLYEYCIKNNVELPENDKNKRHLIQAALRTEKYPLKKHTIGDNIIVVGIATDKAVLEQRITSRTEQMFANGVVNEATMLGKKYGWQAEAMTSNVYRLIKLHLEGQLSLEEVKDKFTTRDWQLAKRQMTWFRRNPFIEWCSTTEAVTYLQRVLARE